MKRREIIRQLNERKIAFSEDASKSTLLALLNPVQNKVTKAINYAGGRGKIEVVFNASDESPAEIMICEEIGKDPWSGEGITVKDIKAALDEITPKNRTLDFFTNSPGGSVWEGTAIRNTLEQWKGRITNTIIGIAASTASWCIPADEVRAYKSSQMFLHKSWGLVMGNADDMQAAVKTLSTTDGQIADMLADQSGRSSKEMLGLMTDETLLTGEEARSLGLVDVLIDGDAKNQFATETLNAMKLKLAALNSLRISDPSQGSDADNNQNKIMNKTEMLALLNKWGVTIPENATDEQLKKLVEAGKPVAAPANAAPPVIPAPAALSADDRATLDALKNQVANSRRKEIESAVRNAASEGRIAVLEIDNWVNDAVAATDHPTTGNPLLARLNKIPAQAPGVPALNELIEPASDSLSDVQTFILKNGPEFRKNFLGQKAQNEITPHMLREISNKAIAVANYITKHKNTLVAAWNSNAIDSDLQRQMILQDMLEAYALQLVPLEAFSVKYESVPLQGLDTVVVPYFPLQATASTQFVKGTGYTTKSDWVENSRKVTVGGDGNAATSGGNATAGTAKDRLYQAIDFTSYDMRRQPYLNVAKLAQQAANKLAVDIFTAIVSRVIVTGNFGAAVKTVVPAAFTPDDIADLAEYATTAQWPEIARSLVLTNTYRTPLLKDTTFKQYLSYGSTDPIRKAQIQSAYGFQDMYFVPALSSYTAANISGWINHKSAVLVAFAPIMPTPEVRNLLTTYDVAVDPKAGCVLEYRKFGDATKDQTTETIESSFGAAKGVDAALKIIKSA